MNFINSPGASLVRALGGGKLMDKMSGMRIGGGDPGLQEMPGMPAQQPIAIPEVANATAQQDALARQNGYRSYDEMMAWARQRQQRREPNTVAQGTFAPQGAPPTPPQGGNAMSWHPMNIFNSISEALRGSRKKDK